MALLGFGERIRQAILDRGSQTGRRYTNVQFGIDVGENERGRGKAYSTQAVSEWIAERSQPSIETFIAMSRVTGKPIPWLMAVDETARTQHAEQSPSGAPREHGDPVGTRKARRADEEHELGNHDGKKGAAKKRRRA